MNEIDTVGVRVRFRFLLGGGGVLGMSRFQGKFINRSAGWLNFSLQTAKNPSVPNLVTYSYCHQRFDKNFITVSLVLYLT